MDDNNNNPDMGFHPYWKKRDEIINKLYSEFVSNLDPVSGYDVEKNVSWGATSDNLTFDIVIRKHKFITVIIDTYLGGNRSKNSFFWRLMANDVFKKTQASLYIKYSVFDDTYLLYDRFDDETDSHRIPRVFNDFNDVVKAIEEASAAKPIDSDKRLEDKKDLEKQYDLRFFEEKVLDPKWCRQQLVTFKDKEICRYSSLDSLFSTLKYGTFRMNGLPGMNDKDEGLFAWDMINDINKLPNDEVKKRKGLINNAFIISYSHETKKDDLIQWRLYGDDAKGVCCVYSVLNEKIDDRFFLHPIKYIEPPQKGQYPTDPLLAKLKMYVDNQSDLAYSDLSPAIFYYKHKDYEPEGEVRLLVDNKKTSAYKAHEFKREWLLTYSNSIPNPYIDIPIKDFPLKLERIILGPNINDIDTIQIQLETMLNQLGIKADVVPSKITSYRNPTK